MATWKLLSVRELVRMLPETTIGGSAKTVVWLARLFAELGSALVLLIEALLLVLPSSMAWAVTVAVKFAGGYRANVERDHAAGLNERP